MSDFLTSLTVDFKPPLSQHLYRTIFGLGFSSLYFLDDSLQIFLAFVSSVLKGDKTLGNLLPLEKLPDMT